MVPLWLYKRPSLIEGLAPFHQCKVLVSAIYIYVYIYIHIYIYIYIKFSFIYIYMYIYIYYRYRKKKMRQSGGAGSYHTLYNSADDQSDPSVSIQVDEASPESKLLGIVNQWPCEQ